jgi:hypothetical protein
MAEPDFMAPKIVKPQFDDGWRNFDDGPTI